MIGIAWAALVRCVTCWQEVHTIGPFYAERLGDYHRLDLRASRTTSVGKGRLTLFIDIQNLYDQENPRGIEIDGAGYNAQPDGRIIPHAPPSPLFITDMDHTAQERPCGQNDRGRGDLRSIS